MKKRILSLFLALVTVFYILPIGSIPAIALDETEEESYLTIEDMEVGKLYKAEFAGEDFYPYALSRFASVIDDELPVLSKDVLEGVALTVVRKSYEDVGVVYIAGEDIDWLGDYSEYRYLYSADLIIVDSEDNSVLWNEMELNEEYSATLWEERDEVELLRPMDASETPKFLEYFYVDVYSEGFLSTTGFPKELIVELVNDTDTYVHVVNEDWPEKYNLFRYVEPEFDINVLGEYTPPADDGYIYGQVNIDCDKAVAGTVYLDEGEKIHAFTELDAEISENAQYLWQIKVGEDVWANITDYIYPYAALSEALIQNAPDGIAIIRCTVVDGTRKYASDELTVQKQPEINVVYAGANSARDYKNGLDNVNTLGADGEGDDDENLESIVFQIRVEYIYRHATNEHIDGKNAAGSFGFAMPVGSSYSGTVTCPPVIGYSPYMLYTPSDKDVIDGTIIREYDGAYYKSQSAYVFTDQKEAISVTIHYLPNQVAYTVRHHEQNLYNDNYSPYRTDTLYGYSDSEVGGELYDTTKEGFSALFYDPKINITPDGMAVIDIYYDRVYYLVSIDLDGGQGVNPYYVRYGTEITLGTPTKLGYTLTNNRWNLTDVYLKNEDDSKKPVSTSLWAPYQNPTPTTTLTIKHNLDYTAGWTKATTKYSVVYWLEDANSKYSNDATNEVKKSYYNVWYAVTVSATTGQKTDATGDTVKKFVSGNYNMPGDAVTDVTNTYPYITYNADLSDTAEKEVLGDGTTVINIYYTRKEYTLKFYYAMSTGEGEGATWYVIGGSTYYATNYDIKWNDNRDNILQMLEKYVPGGGAHSQAGLSTEPTLNAKGTSRSYVKGSDKYSDSSTYRHHYISFDAKYGADISNLWPCDVFNSVTNREKSTTNPNNGWKGTAAYVSAWNGEWRVKYTQEHTGNQTIKGNYTQLDANLLWKDTTITDTTVSYICFWENGAESIGWNYPKLYRYKIWLPTLEGVDYSDKITVTRGGVTYYLADTYDTCDDAMMGGQTNPAIVGFTHIERTGYHVASAGSSYATQPNSRLIDANDAYVGDINSTAGQEEINEIKALVEGNNPTYTAAAIVDHFYERQEFVLTYNDGYNNTDPKRIPYDTLLNVDEYTKPSGPVYPSALEEGQRRFTGWYMDAACTIEVPFGTTLSTMPAYNLQIYAGWEDMYYQVEVYLDESQSEKATPNKENGTSFPLTVKFGDNLIAPAYESSENFIFAGWYYKEDGQEKRFDFTTMPIKKDFLKSGGEDNTAIYAKWTSRVPVKYVIYFKLLGTDIEIAEANRGESLARMHKVFYAKTGSELYEKYREGCYPQVRSVSLEMQEDKDGVSQNVYTFWYTKPLTMQYTVKHTFIDDEFSSILGVNQFTISHTHEVENAAAGEASVNVSFTKGVSKSLVREAVAAIKPDIINSQVNEIVNEIWEEILKLTPNAFQQNLILETQDGAVNEVEFTWRKIETVGKYQVVFYFMSVDGSSYSYIPQYTIEKMGNYGETYKVADPPEYVGFTINREESATALNGAKFENITTDSAGNITGGGLVLKLYYDRITYYYQVQHVLYDDEGKHTETFEKKSALYDTNITVTASVTEHPNYYLVGDTSQTFKLTSGTKDQPFIITFNYMIYKVLYYYQVSPPEAGFIKDNHYTETVESGHSPVGAVPTPINEGWIFEGWYKDAAMTQPVTDSDATVDPVTHKISPVAPTADRQDMEVRFYAKFIPTKRVFINAGSIDAAQAVIYRLQGKSTDNNTKNIDITFVITGTGSITLERLPYGAYTLTVMDWSWRYDDPTVGFNGGTVTGTNGTFDLTLNEVGDVTFTFGAAAENKWLTDDASGTVTPTVTP